MLTDLANFFLGLTKRQGFGLGEEVTEEDTVVKGVGDGVVWGSGSEEVSRDDLGSLVNELVEWVLAVGTSSTPNDRLYAS